MEPTAGTETVPRELVAVQELVNTIDLEDGNDQLDSPEALGRFLTGHGLLGPDGPAGGADRRAGRGAWGGSPPGHGLLGPAEPVGQADLDLAVELREALRAMLRVND